MIGRILQLSVRGRWLVACLTLLVVAFGACPMSPTGRCRSAPLRRRLDR